MPDSRASLERYRQGREVKLQPLYTSDEGDHVDISSDTWPGKEGVLGLTRSQIREARAGGVEPTRHGGFSYMEGPDGALVEYSGNHPKERFNHVHMWQDHPFCAQLWYQPASERADDARTRERDAGHGTTAKCRGAPTARGPRSRAKACIARRA